MKEADDAYQAKDWAKSAKLYEELSKTQEKNARVFYRLGISLNSLGESERAIAALQRALELGMPPQIGEYNLACLYAKTSNLEKAFEYLDKAIAHGFNNPDQLSTDPDLATLRGDSRFASAVERARRNQKPCAYQAENRQFDFWVGEWNVEATQGGTPAGRSKIELIEGDCVIQENWTSLAGGYSGKSYNIYNSSLKRWEQFWVDNVGGMIHFFGELKDGVMDFYTEEIPQPDGTKRKRHLQFFNLGPDRVRQFSQRSIDGGKTWQVEYDFTYVRNKG
jgi:tetratricopeptide (TPR) repeat protein